MHVLCVTTVSLNSRQAGQQIAKGKDSLKEKEKKGKLKWRTWINNKNINWKLHQDGFEVFVVNDTEDAAAVAWHLTCFFFLQPIISFIYLYFNLQTFVSGDWEQGVLWLSAESVHQPTFGRTKELQEINAAQGEQHVLQSCMTPQVHTRTISQPITELAVRQFSIQMASRRQVHHVMGAGCVRTKRLMFQSLNVDTPSALRWAQVSSSDALDSSSRPETDLLQLTTPSIFAQVFLGRILSWWQRSLYCRRRGVLMGVALIRMVEVRLQVVVQGLRISLVKKI